MTASELPNFMSKEKEPDRTDSPELKERLPPDGLDALIVLDAGYEIDKKGNARPTLETKMRLLAAAHLYSLGLTKILILSGGQIFGQEFPSDAQVMKDFLLSNNFLKRRFGEIPEEAILIEERSRNTLENFRFTKEILEEHPEIKTIGVLSHWHHLASGAKIVFRALDPEPIFLSVEEVLKARSSFYRALIKRYYTAWLTGPSKDFRRAVFTGIEDLLRLSILVIDRKGRILDSLTERGITAGKVSKKLL